MRPGPLYLAPPGDVVALETAAERLLDTVGSDGLAGLLDGKDDLSHDLKTMLLYRACFRDENGAFLDRVNRLPVPDQPVGQGRNLLIVPGMNFVKHPETGASGDLVAAIGRRLGFDVGILKVQPMGSTSENAALLEQQLRARPPDPVWVISLSKGTADFRGALSGLGGWPRWLSGWVNLSGVFQGTPVANRITGSRDLPTLALRALIAVGNLVARNIPEMRTDSALWAASVAPPQPDRLVHVIGYPPAWTVEMRISHHYKWLAKHFGPNDGVIPLSECLDYPGRIYPVWGADHFMRGPDLARLVYRLLHYVAIQGNQT